MLIACSVKMRRLIEKLASRVESHYFLFTLCIGGGGGYVVKGKVTLADLVSNWSACPCSEYVSLQVNEFSLSPKSEKNARTSYCNGHDSFKKTKCSSFYEETFFARCLLPDRITCKAKWFAFYRHFCCTRCNIAAQPILNAHAGVKYYSILTTLYRRVACVRLRPCVTHNWCSAVKVNERADELSL